MFPENVGILAMEVYFPSLYVEQSELETHDKVSQGKYTIGLGQSQMGITNDREDVVSICLTVLHRLVTRNDVTYPEIGRLDVATETLIDKSKSLKSYLMQLFEKSGNSNVEGIGTTHACFGGTESLFNAVNWIESSSWDGRFAAVVMGDIAVYAEGPARPTGGTGAVALLVGPNAPLVLDRGLRATHMSHTYDFYKPNFSSEYPIVDGKQSIKCYMAALDACYSRYARKFESCSEGMTSAKFSLNSVDGLVFHSPYCKLVQKSIARLLLNDFLSSSESSSKSDLLLQQLHPYKNEKLENCFLDRSLAHVDRLLMDLSNPLFTSLTKTSLMLANRIGNMYTASLHASLASFLLLQPAESLPGKRIALFSYGSGSAAAMFSLRIHSNSQSENCANGFDQSEHGYGVGCSNRRFSLDTLLASLSDIQKALECRKKITPEQFDAMMKQRENAYNLADFQPNSTTDDLLPSTFYLEKVDELYRRTYALKA